MEIQWLGKGLLITGMVLALTGLAVLFLPKIPWLGRLPGDIVIQRENFRFYFPLASCLVVSLLITLFLHLFKK